MKMLSSEAARAEAEEGSRVLRALADWPSGDIVVSHTNVANLPFARNWWRHLEVVGVHNFALLATDDDAYVRLRRELQAHAVRCPRSIVDGRSTPGPSRYRSAGWTRLMFAVPLMVRWVLRLGLNVLWMDTDVVALANPFPVIRAQLGQRARMGGGADGGADDDGGGRGLILASVDGRFPEEEVSECRRAYSPSARWGRSAGGWKLCGGLFYLRHGAGALAFLRDWERRLAAPGAGAKNQPHYNDALRSATASGMAVELLPCDRFPNGYRYASSAWRAAQAPHTRKPVLVHNNWIKGHEAKLARFREWGMWMDNRTARR
jgi:rhamnogalacturonan II specific xylosyltransferase